MMALTWKAEQALKCSGCGHSVEESMAPGAAYVTDAYVCHACEALSIRSGQDAEDGGSLHGIRYAATKREVGHV